MGEKESTKRFFLYFSLDNSIFYDILALYWIIELDLLLLK
jgi:hypothetical protein